MRSRFTHTQIHQVLKEVHDSSQVVAKVGAACSRTTGSRGLETRAMIGQLKTAPTLTAHTSALI